MIPRFDVAVEMIKKKFNAIEVNDDLRLGTGI